MKPYARILLLTLLLIFQLPSLVLANTEPETAESAPLYKKAWQLVSSQLLADETPPAIDAEIPADQEPNASARELFGYTITVPESLNRDNLLSTGRKLLKYLPYHDDLVAFADDTKIKIRSHIDNIQSTTDDLLSRDGWQTRLDGLASDLKAHEIVTDALAKYENIREPVVTIINNPLEAPGVKGAWDTYENIKEPIATIINDPMQAPGLKQVSNASQKFTSGLKKKLIIFVIIVVVILIIVRIIMNIISDIRSKAVVKVARFALRQGTTQLQKRRNARSNDEEENPEGEQPEQKAPPADLQTEALQAGAVLLRELKDVLQTVRENKLTQNTAESQVDSQPPATPPETNPQPIPQTKTAAQSNIEAGPKRKFSSPSRRFARNRKNVQGDA